MSNRARGGPALWLQPCCSYRPNSAFVEEERDVDPPEEPPPDEEPEERVEPVPLDEEPPEG
jgi:hypothetical protein